MNLTARQQRLKEMIASASIRSAAAAGRYQRLRAQCSHVYVEECESAICAVCEADGGWWCPSSRNHVCEYSVDFDSCDFCGAPDERK